MYPKLYNHVDLHVALIYYNEKRQKEYFPNRGPVLISPSGQYKKACGSFKYFEKGESGEVGGIAPNDGGGALLTFYCTDDKLET